jgi:hypothetical protein
MSGERKVDYVWEQMRKARISPEICKIQCPYCLSVVSDGKPCCQTLGRAMAAILEREDHVEVMMEAANRN